MTMPDANPLTESLLDFARDAAQVAVHMLSSEQPTAGADAASWMRAAREALEARKLADEPLTDGERAAFERLVGAQRENIAASSGALAAVIRQRDDLATFLSQLAATFESAQTDTASRVAAKIRHELAGVFPDHEHAPE